MSTTNRVLINALPKSGTHLLAKAVELCGYIEHFDPDFLDDPTRVTPLFFNYKEIKNGLAKLSKSEAAATDKAICVGTLTPVYVEADVFRYWLDAMPNGNYVLGHIGWSPALAPILAELNYRHVFIIRDPRAVLTSLLSFILDTRGMPRPHFLEADFRTMSNEERLSFLLEGGDAPQAGVTVRGFADVFYSMLAWRNDPNCLLVKFEDLVGERGGGCAIRQQQTLEQIAQHLGQHSAELNPNNIYNSQSRTFRKGSIDSWRQSLDADSIERIDAYCQPLCQAANYTL